MPTRPTSAQQILGENAELNARLKLAESIAAQRSSELEALKKEVEQLRVERARYCERVVLLEEELMSVLALCQGHPIMFFHGVPVRGSRVL